MRCVLRRLRQKECCGGGTLRQRNDGKATEGMETMAVQENRRKADGYANRYEQRYGRKLRSLDARRRRGAARRGFQRERGVRLPCGRPVRHAENVVIRGVAGGNGRGACGVPRPGRIRVPLCGRVPRRTQGGRDVPDRRIRRPRRRAYDERGDRRRPRTRPLL